MFKWVNASLHRAHPIGNAAFVSRASEEVVEEQRERRSHGEQTRERLSTALERLAA